MLVKAKKSEEKAKANAEKAVEALDKAEKSEQLALANESKAVQERAKLEIALKKLEIAKFSEAQMKGQFSDIQGRNQSLEWEVHYEQKLSEAATAVRLREGITATSLLHSCPKALRGWEWYWLLQNTSLESSFELMNEIPDELRIKVSVPKHLQRYEDGPQYWGGQWNRSRPMQDQLKELIEFGDPPRYVIHGSRHFELRGASSVIKTRGNGSGKGREVSNAELHLSDASTGASQLVDSGNVLSMTAMNDSRFASGVCDLKSPVDRRNEPILVSRILAHGPQSKMRV